MPQVTVAYLGMIQRVAGRRREQVDLPASATLADLLHHLARQYGPEFQERVLDGDQVDPMVSILLDGVNAHSLGGLAAPLGDAQQVEVVLFGPPPAGG